jgi:hypothetical protein
LFTDLAPGEPTVGLTPAEVAGPAGALGSAFVPEDEDVAGTDVAVRPTDLTLVQAALAALAEAPTQVSPGLVVALTLPPAVPEPVAPPARAQPGIEGSLTTVERTGGSDSPRPVVLDVADEPPAAEESIGRGRPTPQGDDPVMAADSPTAEPKEPEAENSPPAPADQ